MTCIVHIIKTPDILIQTLKKVRKLFHRTHGPIAAVKNVHISGVGKRSVRDRFARMCWS